MKFTVVSILAGIGTVPFIYAQECLESCSINTDGTRWNFAYVRPTPCNNRNPINTLHNGDYVYNLGNNRFGCGYWYTQVWDSSINKVGWVASQFLDCGGNPPVPAAALAQDNNDS